MNNKFNSSFNKIFRKSNRVIVVLIASLLSVIIICSTILIIYFDSRKRAEKEKKSASEIVDDVSDFVNDKIIGSEGEVGEVSAMPSLEDIISISQLQTLTYNYNSICDVIKKREVVYHVCYKGTVILGIDASEIKISVDDNAKLVSIVLPPIEIQSCNVDASSLKYIFVDEDYNNGSTGANAQALCEEDLEEKIPEESVMFELAKENTITEIRALTEPIIKQTHQDYDLSVTFEEDE